MIPKPELLQDGKHRIPLRNIQCAACDCLPEANGTLLWDAEEGAKFTLEFPIRSSALLGRYYQHPPQTAGVGRILGIPTRPRWVAETADGFNVSLYSLNETLHDHNSPSGSTSQVTGDAYFAVAMFGNKSALSFWNSTPQLKRGFFLGFSSYIWSKEEAISFATGDSTTYTSRRLLLLSKPANVALYEAGSRVNVPQGGWLTYDEQDNADDTVSYPPAVYGSFISFLNGRFTPFLWRDSFIDSSTLQRVYFGANHARLDRLNSSLPLLPLRSLSHLDFAQEVVAQLSSLFHAYVRVNMTLDLASILSPLWSASESLLNDRLALACVSLERLADEWNNSRSGRAASRRRKFWSAKQSCTIRKALRNAIDTLASHTKLDNHQIGVLKSRIDNLGRATNEDKMTAMFRDDFGLELTECEKQVIGWRNKALHGGRSFNLRSTVSEIDDDVLRFDTLRMLITKAVLALLDYRGRYMNYASRSPQNEYEVDVLARYRPQAAGA